MRLRARWIFVVVLLTFTSGAFAQFTRISAAEFQKSPARVAALKKAVKAMKDRDTLRNTTAAYRTSWAYWAATHGYFGTGPQSSGSAAAFKAQASQICAGLPSSQFQTCLTYYTHVKNTPVPNDGITLNVWGFCQHSDPNDGPSQANMQFFTWHRMYLKYFERVLRKSSGDPNFTLPYWDYYQEVTALNRIQLPTMMRGTTSNVLVDQFRTPGLNANTSSISNGTGSAKQAFDFTDFRNFSFALEMQPHGSMHCGTGFGCQAPDIGIVPVAGLDPVFYMHHANIDRLFQCWLTRKANGKPITLAWAKANLGMNQAFFDQVWNFVDENGAPVSMKVSQLFEPGGIDYVYDKVTDCVATPRLVVPEGVNTQVRAASQEQATPLRGKAVSVALSPITLEAPELPLPEGINVEPGRTLLLLENVQITGSPGTTYDIYIRRKDQNEPRAYVATINYFNVLVPHHAGHTDATGPRGHKLLFYDVTDELLEIGANAQSDIAVDFDPNQENVSERAGTVTVGAIRLRVTH